MKRFALLLFGIAMFAMQVVNAQVSRVTGTVTSADDGSTIPGVSIVVKGTTIGTITSLDGTYSIDVPEDAANLEFSFVGMKTVIAPISGSVIDANMEADVIGVDEVMVVAYGTAKKESFTGSASVVKSDQLEKIQTSSITKALQGLSAGVQVTSGSGQPGENATIRIRGIGSFQNNDPLIVVDGFPYDGNLNSISTEDVESITVLKDAAATALYGSRASSGVIIITTKKGQKGTSNLQVRATFGITDRAIPEYDRVNVPQYYELQWEGIYNAYLAQDMDPATAASQASMDLIPTLGGYNAYNVANDQVVGTNGKINSGARLLWNDDWQDELFVTGKRKEVTMSASGGTEKTDYFISGTVLDDQSIIKASDFNRYSVRANVNSEFNDWITVGMNVSGSVSDQNFPNSAGSSYVNSFMYTRMSAPIYPVYLYDLDGVLQTDAEGNKIYDYGNEYGRARAYGSNVNPLGTIELDTRINKRDVFTMRSYIDLQLMDGLSFKVSGSADYYNIGSLSHQNQKYGDAQPFQGRSTRTASRTFTFSSNQILYYDKTFSNHHISALAGHESYHYKFNRTNATRTGFPFPGLVELDAAATAEGSGSYENNHKIESYLTNVSYDFMDRYYASFSFRTDGNSRFHKDVRWGNFWSAGLSWRISEESFLSNQTWINTLRLKASYGVQGNDGIGSLYAYQGLYETGWNNIDYPGLIASRLPTPDLTWEASKQANVGAEIKFLDRFSVNFEYYIRSNTDLLMEQPLPPSTGFTSIDANIAELQNTGFDLEIGAFLVNTDNFDWNMNINLGHYKNEIKALPQDFIISGSKRWEVGRSRYDFWIQEYAGVNSENGKAQWYYDEVAVDADGEVIMDEEDEPVLTGERLLTEDYGDADRYYVGTSIPDLQGGITNSMQIFDFDLSVFVNFAVGGKILDGSYQMLMHGGEYGDHWHTDILDRWTPTNINSDIPIIDGDQDANSRSTRFLTDGDYLSLKNITLGYNLPKSISSKINIASLRLFVSGDNIALFSKRKGLDPQQSISGTPGNQYTPIRTLSFGLDVKF
ncbi:MAG: TonB-dependent receptor [Mariniphaga sp.]|nr:TonB-dependent receptor [Mariniphaga sp.]